jgi:iron-sulfur cluster insertion protein
MSSPNIVFTDSAARKVFDLIQEEGNLDLMLRVYISGGGCSGFQYGFTFDENINPDDQTIEKTVPPAASEDESDGDTGAGTVTLLVDAMSYQYLMGAEIDYREDIQGAQFVIRNPNAKTTCGCGSSFAI